MKKVFALLIIIIMLFLPISFAQQQCPIEVEEVPLSEELPEEESYFFESLC